jgi:hypothetical protein
MKVTSLKEVENYLYASLLAPLKGLVVNMEIPSPLKGNDGRNWHIEYGRTRIQNYRRNYQRDRAMEKRDYLMILIAGNQRHIIGKYFPKGRFVELYKEPFRELHAGILMGKIHHMFNTHAPFTKITIKESAPTEPEVVEPAEVWDSWSDEDDDYGDDL